MTPPVALALALLAAAACSGVEDAASPPSCDPGNAGLTLPSGFCALVVADDLGPARHLAIAPNGDLFLAIRELPKRARGRGPAPGGVRVLRDETGDGKVDRLARFDDWGGGSGLALTANHVYFGTNGAILRFTLEPGKLHLGHPDTIVRGLPDKRQHERKAIALGKDGALYVNVGAPGNACQLEDRVPGSAGRDPCPELESRGGIWRFDANRTGQRQADGERFATGLRNVLALTVHPETGALYGVQHGREVLHLAWPELFTAEESAEKPSEEFVLIERGDDFGWPYCYHDPELNRLVLAPEYGGDGREAGRCAEKKEPLMGFPAHWAPHGLLFYTGEQFPERYRGGAFVAFHGSWNRAPLPQQGYRVAFVPMRNGRPAGPSETFADGFSGPNPSPEADHRPAGIAQGPDGSLYVTDDPGGRIWRIVYRGEEDQVTETSPD